MKQEEKKRLFEAILAKWRENDSELSASSLEKHWLISCQLYGLDPEDRDLINEFCDWALRQLSFFDLQRFRC